mgnify:CR=1 FL=1
MNFSNGAYPRKPSGFGLIEIMIAMTLGIVIILGITTWFSVTSKSLASGDRDSRRMGKRKDIGGRRIIKKKSKLIQISLNFPVTPAISTVASRQ